MIIRPCDVEATSTEPDAEVIEIGAYDIRDGHLYTTGYHTFVKPAAPIPPASSAVHHLTDADVAEAPAWNVAWRKLVELEPEYEGEELIFAAHFAQYERQFFDPLVKARWIDTWKCALRQWPDLDGHKLQELRYSLRLLDHQTAMPALAMPPHRALPDAYLCGFLVLELLNHQSVETLIQWSEEPAVFTKFDFGKFSGKPLSAADDGFLNWMLDKDFSDDWKWNIRREIERRAVAKRMEALDLLLPAIAGAATVVDLENWYHGSGSYLAKHSILVGSAEYEALIQACAARKKALIEGGQPQFGTAS